MATASAETRPDVLTVWKVAIRPFALPASTMPVILGTVLAVSVGGAKFSLLRFLLAFFGMIFLHSASNVLNDVYDRKNGLDKQVFPVSGAVVRGWISSTQALFGAWLLIVAGSACGLALVWLVGLPVLWVGIAGLIIGIGYTWGPWALKYHALGDLAVFLDFGVLGALGAWTVQTGAISWVPAVWAVPMGLLVIGILHANNWRDIKSDISSGINTVASLLGDRSSLAYYAFLMISPFVLILSYVVLGSVGLVSPRMPWSTLAVFIALPLAAKLIQKSLRREAPVHPHDFVALDGATGQFNLIFGLIYIISVALP